MASPSGRRARRESARRLLESFDAETLDRFAAEEPQAWGILQSLLFHPDPVVGWRAVEAAGRVAAVRARTDLDGARELVLRALWLMNDESGGVLWLGPPVLGAALAHVPALRAEFLEILASFLEEEPFRAGTRWALWRVALATAGAVAPAAPALAASLSDPDPEVRGHAALALATAAGPGAAASARGDAARFVLFDPRTGVLRHTTVAEAASGAL